MNISPLSFGSKKISSAQIPNNKTEKNEKFNFVEYECDFYDLVHLKENLDSFETEKKRNLGKVIFRDYLSVFEHGGNKKRFFGFEDKEGNVKALMETTSKESPDKKTLFIDYLAVNKGDIYTNKNREHKKVGSRFFSKAVQYADIKGYDEVSLFVVPGASKFWETVPKIKEENECAYAVLNREDFNSCMQRLDKLA